MGREGKVAGACVWVGRRVMCSTVADDIVCGSKMT